MKNFRDRTARRAVAALALAWMLAGSGALAAGFVPGIEDLPLMTGLDPVAGGIVVFDTPGGRIVESRAAGDLSPARVLEFYAGTLPQLGWRPAGAGRYERENESLAIEFPDSGGAGVAVLFLLLPKPGPGEAR